MRQIPIDQFEIVLQGDEWCFSNPPSSKEAAKLLENNESMVTWLSPKNDSSSTEDHIPAILFQGTYWTLSLRMSKSIYRHVRLSQNFENIQRLHGVKTLRIPRHLLREKQRTQARFERMHQDQTRKRIKKGEVGRNSAHRNLNTSSNNSNEALTMFWNHDIPEILSRPDSEYEGLDFKMFFKYESVLDQMARDIVTIFPSAPYMADDIAHKISSNISNKIVLQDPHSR